MKPGILIGIKDIMAISDVSEATAKRRHARFKRLKLPPELVQYCKWYQEDYEKAKEFLIQKRFDPLHISRKTREERLPFHFEVHTWEERYCDYRKNEVRKLMFYEFLFFKINEKAAIGRMSYLSLPTDFVWYKDTFEVPLFDRLIEALSQVERREELLYFFGLKAGKYRKQKRLGLVLKADMEKGYEFDFASVLRNLFHNSKKLWFCSTDVVKEKELELLSFREIRGTGFAVAALPGGNRFGKVDVWMEFE